VANCGRGKGNVGICLDKGVQTDLQHLNSGGTKEYKRVGGHKAIQRYIATLEGIRTTNPNPE
jgi:hypothetical protein